jgi:hypothetical protein
MDSTVVFEFGVSCESLNGMHAALPLVTSERRRARLGVTRRTRTTAMNQNNDSKKIDGIKSDSDLALTIKRVQKAVRTGVRAGYVAADPCLDSQTGGCACSCYSRRVSC